MSKKRRPSTRNREPLMMDPARGLVCSRCGSGELMALRQKKSALDGRHGWKCLGCQRQMGAYRSSAYGWFLVGGSLFCILCGLGLVLFAFLVALSGERLQGMRCSNFFALFLLVVGPSFLAMALKARRGKMPVPREKFRPGAGRSRRRR